MMGNHGTHRKHGLVWRLTMFVFVSLVVVFVFSFVVHPQVRAEYYPYGQARGDAYFTMRVSLGRVTLGRSEYGVIAPTVSELEEVLDRMGRGWVVEMYAVRAPFSYDRAWWALPGGAGGGSSRGTFKVYSIPMIYPIVLIGAAMGVATIRARRATREGWCKACGYSLRGIQGDVCPECGVGCA